MPFLYRFSFIFLLFIGFFQVNVMAQEVIWASKIVTVENAEKEYENNHLSMLLGPPTIYPNQDYEQNAIDIYADGYIIHPSSNKKEQIDVAFSKNAIIANQICIAGIFNQGTIKKVYVKRKDNTWVQVYTFDKLKSDKKFHSIIHKFPLETVYGVRIIIDHSRVNYWNLLKGIGLSKGSNPIQIRPDLYENGTTFGKKRKLPSTINSPTCTELNPRISSDGSVLYFTRDCNDTQLQDIFYSNLIDNQWELAKNIGTPLNNTANNFVISTSFDPKTLFVANKYGLNGEYISEGASITRQDSEGNWATPLSIDVPTIEGKEVLSYFITMDKTAMILVAEDKLNKTNSDLYVSLFNKYKNVWDVPFSLGTDINSEIVEDFPFLGLDGKTLFFCSNGRLGYGGFDIYVSKRLDNTWTKWSKPQNLGPNINSETDDLTFSVSASGDRGYFSTYTTDVDFHNVDIYQVKLPPSLEQPSLIAFRAKVVNEKTNEPLSASVKLTEFNVNNEWIDLLDDGSGIFSHALFEGKNYLVDINAIDYFRRKDTILLDKKMENSFVSKNYSMKPFLDSGQVTVIKNIRFDFNSNRIIETSFPYLDQIAKQLIEQRKAVIEISGHTDNVGSDTFNLRLSDARAKAVVDYLTFRGVRPWRMKAKGFGKNKPIASNETEDGRALNRRVEMTILDNDFTKKYIRANAYSPKRKKSKLVLKHKVKSKSIAN